MDAPATNETPVPPPSRPRRRWLRLVGAGLLVLVVLAGAAVALLPTLAGSAQGRALVESQINARIPGRVSIDAMKAAWFGGQRLEGVTLRDPEGAQVLTVAALDLPDVGIWGLARGSRDFGSASLSGVRLDVVKDAAGQTNLERALDAGDHAAAKDKPASPGSTPESSGGGLPQDLALDLSLADLAVSYREPDRAPLGAAVSTGRVTLAGGGLKASFDSTVSVGDDAGQVSAELDGVPDATNPPRWTGRVDAVALPLAAIDAWVQADGLLTAALGDAAGFTVSPDAGGAVQLYADTAAGTGGVLKLIDDGVTLRLAEEATFSLVQTPELSDKVTRLVNPVLMPAVVSAKQPLVVTLDPDAFAVGARGFDWSQVNAKLRLDLGTVAVLPSREPFAGLAQQLQAVGVLKQASLYDLDVQPIELAVEGGVFRYLPQHFKLDDVTLTFDGLLSMTDRVLDVRLVPGGREIDRDPLLRTLVAGGVKISGTLDNPQVELGSLTDALSQERVGDTLVNLLGGLLERELRKDETEEPAR